MRKFCPLEHNSIALQGGIVELIILVNVIGCIKTKRTAKLVKDEEIEMYWNDLAKRDNAAKSD